MQSLVLACSLVTFVFCFYCTVYMNKAKIHFFHLFKTDLVRNSFFFLNVLPICLLKSHLGNDKRLNTKLCGVIAL